MTAETITRCTAPFRDPLLAESFASDGFVIVDLIQPHEIDEIRSRIDHLIPRDFGLNDPFAANYVSYFDLEIREQASDLIRTLIGDRLVGMLDAYRLMFATVFVKPGRGAETPIHQHSPYVASMCSTTIGCWCPLVDCGIETGTLQIVRGSHGLSSHIHSPSRPAWWQDCVDVLRSDYLETIEVGAGQAVLFDDSIPHGASANHGNRHRTALLATLVPEASVNAVVFSDEDATTAYEVPHPFGYSEMFNGRLDITKLRPVETLDGPGEMMSESELRQRLAVRGILPTSDRANRDQHSDTGEGEW